jgi:hypothetical protein
MARRKSSSKKAVSLFPFLDILACVIGNLILIITTVVLDQMDSKPLADAARLENLRQETVRQSARRAELEKQLQELRQSAGDVDERIAQAQQQVDEAKRKFDEANRQLAAAEAAPTATVQPPTPKELERLQAQRRKIDEEIARIEAEILERKTTPERAIVLLPPASGGAGPTRGIFVEVTSDRLVVHQDKQPWEVPAAKIAGDLKFQELLNRIEDDDQAIITFLVRPNGIATLRVAERTAAAQDVRTGRVPLPGDGKLDLSTSP